jgi:hypothetical protein
MARTTSKGLYVWDLSTDAYDHTQLAANWDKIDQLLGSPATSMQVLAAVPVTSNFAGRLVMLSASDSGFQPWTLIRFDGSAWRAIGYEIQPAVPTSGNFAGRIVVLSSAASGFNAWDVIRYDGSAWNIVGGWSTINTGAGALNITGIQTGGDVYVNASARGFVLADRADGTKRRLYLSSGALFSELVT